MSLQVQRPILSYVRLDVRGEHEERHHPITLRERYEEGYPTGYFSFEGLQDHDLQRLADWMITLPIDQYEPVAEFHRALEIAVIQVQERNR